MTNIIKKFIKNITYFMNNNECNTDDIPMMRYPEGYEDKRKNFVNPFAKYNSHNSRIQYRRSR